ncbi:hypothetical protein EIP86_003151 [Pleurotus ostreatoroseus]|nr:hypothetical protein EIP86_003151 [Pleurotus ostreatoroseus]
MASTSSDSWIHASGKYDIQLGSSLNRHLRALKKQAPPKSKLPDRDFYSFRFNFVPEGVDTTKPGTAEVRSRDNNSAAVTVERASTQPDADAYTWTGHAVNAKDTDCVLIWDPDMQATVPVSRSIPSSSSSSASSSHVPLSQTHSRKQALDAASRLEAELELELNEEDAPGDLDEEFEQLVPDDPPKKAPLAKREATTKPKATLKGKARAAPSSPALPRPKPAAQKEEEEESEGEIIEKPKKVTAPTTLPPVRQSASTKQKPAPRVPQEPAPTLPVVKEKPTPRPRPLLVNHALPPKPSPALPASASAAAPKKVLGKKREYPSEETFDLTPITQPSPPKRARRSPSPKSKPKEEFSLALPGGPGISLPPAPPVAAPDPAADSDESEEWDDVLPVSSNVPPVPMPPPPGHAIVMEEIEPEPTRIPPPQEDGEDEGEEIDEDLFAAQLDEHLVDEEDGEGEPAMSPLSDPHAAGVPMSMNAYAGGSAGENIWGDDDDDDDSDSDDSDDE